MSQPQAKAIPAKLNYSITLRCMWGTLNGKEIKIHVESGGRAGSKIKGAVDAQVANNVFEIDRKTNEAKNIHGGPLPIGTYTISSPANNNFGTDNHGCVRYVYSAKLTPIKAWLGMMGRSGFYIHGRGSHGSDGCIVPMSGGEYQTLMKGLEKSKGGSLTVWP